LTKAVCLIPMLLVLDRMAFAQQDISRMLEKAAKYRLS
jgi:hypothetical protein